MAPHNSCPGDNNSRRSSKFAFAEGCKRYIDEHCIRVCRGSGRRRQRRRANDGSRQTVADNRVVNEADSVDTSSSGGK